MSQLEKTRSRMDRCTGKNPLRHRGSIVMKKSGPVNYNRKCKEEPQELDTERNRVDGSHSLSSSDAPQIQLKHEVLETIQPGNVQRLVEKFRRLGESTLNSKPHGRNVSSKRLSVSGSMTESFAILRKKSDRSKNTRMTEEKWILVTPSLFSNHEINSCSVSLSQPTISVFHHEKPPSCSADHMKPRDGGLQDIVLGCEHDTSEIVLPIECFTIENPAERHKRLTIGGSKDYLPMGKGKADDEPIYEEIKAVETHDCDETKENPEGISQNDLVIVKNDAHYDEIEYNPLEVCYVSSLISPRKERIYDEIDSESVLSHSEGFSHSDAGKITAKDSESTDHTSNSIQNFISDESIYEEIYLNPPMIIVHEENLSPSPSLGTSRTLDSNRSETLSVTGSQCDDVCSVSSVFEDSFSTDSIISDLDEYDIVYRSEIFDLEFSRMNSDTSRCDQKNVHHKRSVKCSSSGSEICRKPRNKFCQCKKVSSETSETCECKKIRHKTASGSNSEENIYENYQLSPASVSRNVHKKPGAVINITADGCSNFETGCPERGPSTASTDSFSSSSYESFSSDDEYVEDVLSEHVALMQRSEEPSVSSSIEEPVTKLDRVIRELLETERKYIARLKLINDEFRVAVTTWNREKNYIPVDIVRQMFLNIDIIYQLHSGFFLPELEACVNEEKRRKVEDVFMKGADFLKLYAEYSCNFSTAMKLIEQWKSKVPEFSRFILDIQQKSICQSLTLEHHMLEPILRIPRYELLLNKYLEYLPEDSLEREKTLKAVQKVTAAASHCNDFIKSMEKYRRVMDVQQSLWSKVDLMTPSRELIMDGLMKVTQQQCKDEDKHLFLFNDTLLVCKAFPLGITPPYKLTLQLDIDGMKVVDRKKEEVVETFFVISNQGYLEMHPSSKKDKEKWISGLNAVIEKYMALEKSRRNSTILRNPTFSRQKSIPGTQAPIWIKDPQANRCMQCSDKFTAIKRRHHCRACGIVVCGKCSSKEASLAYDKFSKLHRVCDKCFSEISISTKDTESEAKASRSLNRNVPHVSRDSDCSKSIFFILPDDEDYPHQLKSKEEKAVTEVTPRLDAIIETDTESKDGQKEVT